MNLKKLFNDTHKMYFNLWITNFFTARKLLDFIEKIVLYDDPSSHWNKKFLKQIDEVLINSKKKLPDKFWENRRKNFRVNNG